MKKIAILIIMILTFSLILSACGNGSDDLLNFKEPKKGDTIVTMKTSMGDIKILMFNEVAPKAVENFTTHAKNGYYDGITFHRVMNDFMIQGGDPDASGSGGQSIWGESFEDELSKNALNIRGALSMANSGTNTNGSQFFIVQASKETLDDAFLDKLQAEELILEENRTVYTENGGTPWLDNLHTVFGQVIEGMDIVDAIAAVEVDANSKPLETVTIVSMEVSTVE